MKHINRLPKKFGKYGGQFVPEVLMPAIEDLETAYINTQQDESFQNELNQ